MTLPAGTYYIVVEAHNDAYGPYDLSVICEECTDADGDTYTGYDETLCMSGTDCCDAGDETSPGCTAGTAAGIYPGAEEICNDIDDDCNTIIDDGDVCERDKGCGCAATDGTPASGLFRTQTADCRGAPAAVVRPGPGGQEAHLRLRGLCLVVTDKTGGAGCAAGGGGYPQSTIKRLPNAW